MERLIFTTEARHIATLVFRKNVGGLKLHLNHLKSLTQKEPLRRYEGIVNTFINLWKGDSVQRQHVNASLANVPLYTQLGLLTVAESAELGQPLEVAYKEVSTQFTPLYGKAVPQTWEAYGTELANLFSINKSCRKAEHEKRQQKKVDKTPAITTQEL